MAKLELTISTSTYQCISMDETSAQILAAAPGDLVSYLLADEREFDDLKMHMKSLAKNKYSFCTLDLVFRAPGISSDTEGVQIDRSPIQGVFRSPIQAIHTCGEMELACFVHLQLVEDDRVCLTAIEFSREYRENKLRQEFGSWLLEEHIENSVIATDPDGTIVFWNRFASSLYQYDREEAIGKNIVQLTPSDVSQEQGVEIFSRLQKGENWKGFFGVKRKDATQFVAHVTDTPILKDNDLKFIVGVSADYSEMHKLLEELKILNQTLEDKVRERTKELLEQGERLRMVGTAVEQSDTGAIICRKDYRIAWVNPAVTNMLSNDKDIINKYPWELPIDYQLGPIKEEGDEAVHSHSARPFFETSSGHATVFAQTRPGPDQRQGTPLRISIHAAYGSSAVILIRDLTAEKKADEAQRQAEKEAAASKSKTEMMCMLSHEFRTPLQGIMGITSTALLDLEDGTELHECLSTVAASSKLLLTLINNVLDLGKIDADRMLSLEVNSFPVCPCILDAITFCESFAKINEVTLTFDVGQRQLESNLEILANRLRMEQIMINLISNAVKYTRKGTNVSLGVRLCSYNKAVTEAINADISDIKLRPTEEAEILRGTESRVIVISVRDQGRGIPKDEAGLLFGEYSQLRVSIDKDRNHGGKRCTQSIGQSSGSGLGLSLVLKFLAMLNGHIWVHSSESGACFSICLPEGEVMPPTHKRIKNTPIGEPSGPSLSLGHNTHACQNLRVLLVDDSLINLKVLERMLRRASVMQVKAFSRAMEAIDWLRDEQNPDCLPDLILSDLQMPEMDGFEFMAEFLEMENALNKKPLKIMACSADWTPEAERKCLSSGFHGVLRKPIIFSVLCDFLKSVHS